MYFHKLAGARAVPVIALCVVTRLVVAEPTRGPTTPLDATDRAREVRAGAWFNAQPVHLFQTPRLALIEFWSVGSPESRRLVGCLNRLNRTYTDGRLTIIALTEDDKGRVASFIRRQRVSYKVGADSRSADDYGVRELPSVFLVDLKEQRVVWHGEGRGLDPKQLEAAVSAQVGRADGADRSARRAAEEEADRALIMARGAESERLLSGNVDAILSSRPAEEPLQPADLQPLDEFYEANLPTDALGPDAPSESYSRLLAAGAGDESGYGKLAASGRLSEDARLDVQERLLSMVRGDPNGGVRMNAAVNLGRFVGRQGDGALLEALREVYDLESDAFVRGRIQEAIDRIAPATATVKETLDRPSAYGLRRQLASQSDPASSRWADAHAYSKTVAAKGIGELLKDYWATPDGAAEPDRENAILKRNAALLQVSRRIPTLSAEDFSAVQSNFVRMLGSESDVGNRRDVVLGLWELAKKGGASPRAEITHSLEEHLPRESDQYLVAPTIKTILDDLKPNP